MDAQGKVAVFVHAAAVNRIESTYFLNGAAVVVKHHAALPGICHMLFVSVKRRNVIQLIASSQIKKLVSQVRLW